MVEAELILLLTLLVILCKGIPNKFLSSDTQREYE